MARGRVLVIDDSPTILKVVQLVLTKVGYTVDLAADGEEGLCRAAETRPDLILVDFIMPRMNGYQFCRALGDSEGLRGVPVVLMSAKGEQVGEQFVRVMGIVDYITKPFSPEAIRAVVEHALAAGAPATDPRAAPAPPPRGGRRTQALAAVRASLEEMLAAHVAPEGAALERLIEAVAPVIAEADRAALRGRLDEVPLAQVLGLCEAQRQTGILTISRSEPPARVELAFGDGRIDLALAYGLGEELRVGRYLVDLQAISRQDLELFLHSRAPSPLPLGEQLLKLGYIGEADLEEALARQAAERIYEVLRWPTGSFALLPTELPPLAIQAALGLDVEGVLMEGLRRIDEWHLIEREVDDFGAVYLRNEEAVARLGEGLEREEREVLELVNGRNSVKDVLRLSRMPSYEVCRALFRLATARLVRRRVPPFAVDE